MDTPVANIPAVILAPMDGFTDAPMRAVQGEIGAFTYAVAEFIRISVNVPSYPVFHRHVPELLNEGKTKNGLPVHVQLLGGDPERMAQAAWVAYQAGANAIDINFGCPAPTVNNHDGGATLLKHPQRIREIVQAVRRAVPEEIAVSAKLRLGWASIDDVFENAEMAAEGGAAWITLHARTREQGYNLPVYWGHIGSVRERLDIPVVANGNIWTLDDFRRCREETGCIHYMLGRGALANPFLSHQIAHELGLITMKPTAPTPKDMGGFDWRPYLQLLADHSDNFTAKSQNYLLRRLKQWLKIANLCGTFDAFDAVKRSESTEEMFAILEQFR